MTFILTDKHFNQICYDELGMSCKPRPIQRNLQLITQYDIQTKVSLALAQIKLQKQNQYFIYTCFYLFMFSYLARLIPIKFFSKTETLLSTTILAIAMVEFFLPICLSFNT